MAQIPEIKPEVNKEPEDRKKKAGLFARLFGGGGSGGGFGAGGFGGGGFGGAGGGFGGAAASGGVLATKAGLLAFILAGSTVAAGIGLVGYRFFGPGSDQSGDGSLSIFAPKPKATSGPDAQAPKDGGSQSLSMLAQGNQDLKKPDAAAAAPGDGAAPKDETAASAASTAEKAGGGSINGEAAGGGGAAKGLLKGGSRFGELSKGVGGGGGPAVTAGGNSAGKLGEASNAVASTKGALGGKFANGARAEHGGRSIAGRRAGGALHQAIGALGDQKGALSSYSAGRTYDGSAANNGSAIGPEAGAPSVGGAGETGAPQPKSIAPNSANQLKDIKAPPTPTPKMEAPWQNAIKTAQGILAVASLLLLIASMLAKSGPWGIAASKVIGYLVAAMGAVVIALGAQIATGKYGQTLQGGVLAAAGAGLVLAGLMAGMADNTKGGAKADGDNGTAFEPDAGSADNTSAFGGKPGDGSPKDGMFAGVNYYVLIGGGMGLVGLAASAMMPPKKYPSTQFQNGNPPDSHWFGYREMPSQKALARYLA